MNISEKAVKLLKQKSSQKLMIVVSKNVSKTQLQINRKNVLKGIKNE